MECRFSKGDVARVNTTAEVSFKYRTELVTIMEAKLIGKGKLTRPLQYDNECFVTIQTDDGTILDMVPDSELSSI